MSTSGPQRKVMDRCRDALNLIMSGIADGDEKESDIVSGVEKLQDILSKHYVTMRSLRWMKVCEVYSAVDVVILHKVLLDLGDDWDPEWEAIFTGMAGETAEARVETVGRLEKKGTSGPKMKHTYWKGGDLTKWMRFVENFKNLAVEFGYTDEQGYTRLLLYTTDSPDREMIELLRAEGLTCAGIIDRIHKLKLVTKGSGSQRELTDVSQGGKESVEDYFNKFQKNRREIEQIKGRKFPIDEVIEKFNKGLWLELKKLIITARIPKDNFFEYFIQVQLLEKEFKVITAKSPDDKKKTNLTAAEIRKQKPCHAGKNCTRKDCPYKHDFKKEPRERGICFAERDRGRCDRRNCPFRHKKKDEREEDSKEDDEPDLGKICFYGKTLNVHGRDEGRVVWDSGTNVMIHYKKEDFIELKMYDKPDLTVVGGDTEVPILGRGFVMWRSESCRLKDPIKMEMSYAPDFGLTLVSHSKLDRKGVKMVGENGIVKFSLSGHRLMTAKLASDELYDLDIRAESKTAEGRKKNYLCRIKKWHDRLGHQHA